MRLNDAIWDTGFGPGPHPVRDMKGTPACFKIRSRGQFESPFPGRPQKDLEMLGLEKRNRKLGDGSTKGPWMEGGGRCSVLAGSWN